MSQPVKSHPTIVMTIAYEVARVATHRESPVEVAERIVAELTAAGWRPPACSGSTGTAEQADHPAAGIGL